MKQISTMAQYSPSRALLFLESPCFFLLDSIPVLSVTGYNGLSAKMVE